ncbi:hypothetical protein [Desulfovibrio legallii]|uniref:Uncharacterized protein n=1 Tax=Desulfovibrio legallii TaxID=571438 RepID=A0A1G7Q5L1_9BACT|nr:hypothetical protein [Desulfovibrio legallii]SDF93763.1 hypothetical protein SAMN05192586_11934 [Desulfovibrio legallii]
MPRSLYLHRFSYAVFAALLAGSALFLLTMLGKAVEPEPAAAGYAPGFAVRADHVRVVQVVPLAGASLRSPSASPDRAAVALPY